MDHKSRLDYVKHSMFLKHLVTFFFSQNIRIVQGTLPVKKTFSVQKNIKVSNTVHHIRRKVIFLDVI